MPTNRNRAVAMILFSALAFAIMQVIVKLSAGSVATMQQVFSRNLISAVVSFLILRKRGIQQILGPRNYQLPLIARSFFGFIGIIMLFTATKGARQADISLLNRTSPIWITLFARLILKEKITKVQIPVIGLCLVGAFVAMQPSFDSNFFPMFLALMTAVVCGIAYTMIAFCRGHVDPMVVIFHFSLFSTVAGGILMIPTFRIPTLAEACMLFLIGLFGAAGQVGLTYAYQLAPASEVSIYDYSGIIFSALLGYLLLGETLTVSTIVGAVLITCGGLWSYFYNNRRAGQIDAHG